MERAFVGRKRVKDQSHMPKQGWCFLPPEPHISYHFTLACGPKRPAPWEPGSLPIFPALHLFGGCLKCSAWDSLHPQMCFKEATLWGAIKVKLKARHGLWADFPPQVIALPATSVSLVCGDHLHKNCRPAEVCQSSKETLIP